MNDEQEVYVILNYYTYFFPCAPYTFATTGKSERWLLFFKLGIVR